MRETTSFRRRIVLTGGPGSGKTVISAELGRRMPDRLICVPEAATRVYFELATRWDRLDVPARRDLQRRIYHRQKLQEEQGAAECGNDRNKVMLCDRGTVDGAAYWPDGPDAFWIDLGTTRQAELARYDAVIWLETSATLGLYDGDASNGCRFEDAAGAIETGRRSLQAWEGHANLVRVAACGDLNEKVAEVVRVVRGLVDDIA